MSNIDKVIDAVKYQMDVDDNLTKIFRKYFEMDAENRKDDVGFQAWATYALDVSIQLCNLFMSVKRPDSGRHFRAICDMSYRLHANEFWTKASAFLMPLVTVSLNSHKNYVELKTEFKNTSEYAMYDKVMAASEYSFLDIFSAILYLVGGPSLMAASSLPLKLDLAPYFLD